MSYFGKELGRALTLLEITETELAREIGKTQGWINQLKNANTPPARKPVEQICAVIQARSNYRAKRIMVGYLKDQRNAAGFDTHDIIIKLNKNSSKN